MLRPSALLVLSTGAERVSGLLSTVLVGRVLGPQSLGEYSLVLALWNVFSVVAYFGQAKLVARDVARAPDLAAKLLGTSSILGLLASVVAGALMIGTTMAFGYPEIVIIGAAVAAATLLWADSQCSIVESMLISMDRTHIVAGVNLIASVARATASLLMLIWRIDVIVMLAILGVTQMGTAIVLFIAASRVLLGRRLRWDSATGKAYFRGAFVFTLLGLAGVAFKRVDALMLEAMLGTVALGIYSAAYRITQIAHSLAPPIFRVLAPQFSVAERNVPGSSAELTHTRLRALGLLFGALTCALTLVGPHLLTSVFGAAYATAALPFILLSTATLPLTAQGFFTIVAAATNLEAEVLRINVVNGVIDVALNLALIPVLGPLGSALALLIVAIIGVIQGGMLLQRHNMLAIRASVAAMMPAVFWMTVSTCGALVIDQAGFGFGPSALLAALTVGGLMWSYRVIVRPGIRPVAEKLVALFRGRR